MLGVDPSGQAPMANGWYGVQLVGAASIVTKNVISGNSRHGVVILGESSKQNSVHDNIIGLSDGIEFGQAPTAIPNGGNGVFVKAAENSISSNSIGGNVQSGVALVGVHAHGNSVTSNAIGGLDYYRGFQGSLAPAGFSWQIANGVNGVTIQNAEGNTIGSKEISFNQTYGVQVNGRASINNRISYNELYGDPTAAQPVQETAVYIVGGAQETFVGFNTISDVQIGIQIADGITSHNEVRDNLIESTHNWGIYLRGGSNEVVDNSINPESGRGIGIAGNTGQSNEIIGNSVGGDIRIAEGIRLFAGARQNLVSGNQLTNIDTAVFATHSAGIGNTFTQNHFRNVDMPVDIGNLGLTPNDAQDADSGPNQLQNFPVVVSAIGTAVPTLLSGVGTSTDLTVALDSAPESSAYPISVEVYRWDTEALTNPRFGQAAQYHTTLVFTQPETRTVRISRIGIGHNVSLLATDANGNTSEMSPRFEVVGQ